VSARVSGQLALVEARRLVRDPLVLGGAGLMLVVRTAVTWTSAPIWRVVADGTEYASLILAAAALLAAHRAGGRDHRYGAAEFTSTLPVPPRRRTAGLLAVVPAAALVAALAVAVHLVSLLPSGPGGRFDGWDLLASAALPALGAGVGLALARWRPGAMAGALGLAGGAAVLMLTNFLFTDPDSPVPQLSPLLPYHATVFDVPPRLTGWHLVYLLALTGAAVGVAVARHADGRGRRARAVVAIGLAVAVAATAGATKVAANPPGIRQAQVESFEAPAAYDCQRYGGVGYCAFHGYAGWIARWRSAVEPVVAAVPAARRDGLPAVRQIDNPHSIDPYRARDVVVPTHWGRWGRWAQRSRAELTAWYAAGAAHLPGADWTHLVDGQFVDACWAGGQPRAVVALWLAAQALPDGARLLGAHAISLYPARYGDADVAAARALLARPRAAVSAALDPLWPRLLSPAAPADLLTGLGAGTLPTGHPDGMPTCP
jgi:hypothetical protein